MIGIIGGSGISEIHGITDSEWVTVDTPYGAPSDQLLVAYIQDQRFVFLPRHGRGHVISPSAINYRANIFALKKLGVNQILSISAVGSLNENLPPGKFLIVDQFIDRTFAREKTFFDKGLVAHVSMADPVCSRLGNHIEQVASKLNLSIKRNGTYLVMEGPQFSTLAESKMYRAWGCDVIGMTNMPEAKLAREAEICYATLAMVTDFDCWHPGHATVNVQQIIEISKSNVKNAIELIQHLFSIKNLEEDVHKCPCQKSLNNSMMTSKFYQDVVLVEKLKPILERQMEEI